MLKLIMGSVTKVQRPLIADMMRKDFVLLNKLADLVNIVEEDSDEQVIDFKSVIAEVERVTKAELDFRVEAENTRLFRDKCIDDEELISCPTVMDGLTTERIFTMTYIDGCSVGDTEKLAAEGCDLDEIGRVIVDSYLHQVLDVGTFHADPHQGNILVSHGKPYWIDFGMIGHVTDKDIDLIQDAVKALLSRRCWSRTLTPWSTRSWAWAPPRRKPIAPSLRGTRKCSSKSI